MEPSYGYPGKPIYSVLGYYDDDSGQKDNTTNNGTSSKCSCRRCGVMTLKVIIIILIFPFFVVLILLCIIVGIVLIPVMCLAPWLSPYLFQPDNPQSARSWGVQQPGRLLRWVSQDHLGPLGRLWKKNGRSGEERMLMDRLDRPPYTELRDREEMYLDRPVY